MIHTGLAVFPNTCLVTCNCGPFNGCIGKLIVTHTVGNLPLVPCLFGFNFQDDIRHAVVDAVCPQYYLIRITPSVSLLLHQELADSVSSYCLNTYFKSPVVNQGHAVYSLLSPPCSAAIFSPTTDFDVVYSNLDADVGLPNVSFLDFWKRYLLYSNLYILLAHAYNLLFPMNPTRVR